MTTPAKVRHGSAIVAGCGWLAETYTEGKFVGVAVTTTTTTAARFIKVYNIQILYTLRNTIPYSRCVYYCNESACGKKKK